MGRDEVNMLTEFGKTVRKARIDAGVTMNQMAIELDTTASFLSAIETGRKKVPPDWISLIENYFDEKGVKVLNLGQAADVSNQSVSLEGLSSEHKMLVSGFARIQSSAMTAEDVMGFKQLLQKIEEGSK